MDIIITASILTHEAGVKAGTMIRAFVGADIIPGMDTQDRTAETLAADSMEEAARTEWAAAASTVAAAALMGEAAATTKACATW